MDMDFMFDCGFLGTRAPLFMDVVTLIVAALPFLVAGAIYFAKKHMYKVHAFLQIFLFIFSALVLLYFEIGVRMIGGFEYFIKDSEVAYIYAYIVLVFHITVSMFTLIIWAKTLFSVKKQIKQHKHKRSGILVFGGVVLTSLTGIWVYFLMFTF